MIFKALIMKKVSLPVVFFVALLPCPELGMGVVPADGTRILFGFDLVAFPFVGVPISPTLIPDKKNRCKIEMLSFEVVLWQRLDYILIV